MIGQHYSNLVSNPNKELARYVFAEPRDGHSKSNKIELKRTCKDGSEHRYFDTTSISINPGGADISVGVYGVARDATEKKQAQDVINHHAHQDTLTKLPNPVLMEDRLSVAITQTLRNGQKLAVIFLDLERFKWINDALGHTMGDRLPQSVSHRLKAAFGNVTR